MKRPIAATREKIMERRFLTVLFTVIGCLLHSPSPVAAWGTAPKETSVVFTGTWQVNNPYCVVRIPAIVASNDGTTLLAFAEGRASGADNGNIDVILKRSVDGGETWGPTQVIWSDGLNTCGNPAPVVDRVTGTIWLHMARNDGEDSQQDVVNGSRKPRTAWLTSSPDNGATWSAVQNIDASIREPHWRWYGTGPCNGIQLRNGRLVIPTHSSARIKGDGGDHDEFYPFVIYSDDHGVSWHSGAPSGNNGCECTVAELPDDSLMLNIRQYPNMPGSRGVAVSKDGGLSWPDPIDDENLADVGCQGSLLQYTTQPEYAKNRLLFCNPTGLGPDRTEIAVQLSYDNGKTWAFSKVIQQESSGGYSNLVVLPDMSIGVLYEAAPCNIIKFTRFTLEWLTDG